MSEEMVRHGFISAWAKEFGIPERTLRARLKDSPFVIARLHKSSRTAKGYAEDEVRRACADILEKRS